MSVRRTINAVIKQCESLALDDEIDREVLEEALMLALQDQLKGKFSRDKSYIIKAQDYVLFSIK